MDAQEPNESRSRALVIAGVLIAAAVALYFGLGMPGMDHGSTMSSVDHAASTSLAAPDGPVPAEVRLLNPSSFSSRIGNDAVLLNVHVPFEGDIEGTKFSIPFDKIAEQASSLPADLDTPLLVYCRSGRMSAIAAAELVRLGYRDVSDLDGGMQAWEKSGRLVLRTGSDWAVS